jgi:hypothetical protein
MASAHDFGSGEGVDRTQLPYLLLASAGAQENRDRENFGKIVDVLVPTLESVCTH